MKPFLFCAVLLTSVWSRLSATLAGSASLMAKEFTSDIVWRKDLACVTHGGPSQTLDLYAPKKAKNVPLIVWIHGGLLSLWLKRGLPPPAATVGNFVRKWELVSQQWHVV
jgi:hypothetical protein